MPPCRGLRDRRRALSEGREAPQAAFPSCCLAAQTQRCTLPLVLGQGSPIIHSSCEGELGVLQGWHPLGQHPCQGLEPEEPTSSLCSAFYWSCVLVWIFPRSLSFLFLDGKRRTPDSGCTGELKDPQGLGLARRRYTVSIKSLSFWESNFGTAPGPYTGGSLHMETRLLPALSLLLFSHSVVSSLHPPVLSFSHMDAISKS